MKHLFSKKELEAMPLNMILSFPTAPASSLTDESKLKRKRFFKSCFHQNENKASYEGFYKSISRRIANE